MHRSGLLCLPYVSECKSYAHRECNIWSHSGEKICDTRVFIHVRLRRAEGFVPDDLPVRLGAKIRWFCPTTDGVAVDSTHGCLIGLASLRCIGNDRWSRAQELVIDGIDLIFVIFECRLCCTSGVGSVALMKIACGCTRACADLLRHFLLNRLAQFANSCERISLQVVFVGGSLHCRIDHENDFVFE